jgi:hypothetical protein
MPQNRAFGTAKTRSTGVAQHFLTARSVKRGIAGVPGERCEMRLISWIPARIRLDRDAAYSAAPSARDAADAGKSEAAAAESLSAREFAGCGKVVAAEGFEPPTKGL